MGTVIQKWSFETNNETNSMIRYEIISLIKQLNKTKKKTERNECKSNIWQQQRYSMVLCNVNMHLYYRVVN